MATFINGGNEVFNALAYQPPHPSTYAFLDNVAQDFRNTIHATTQSFFNVANTVYDTVSASESLRIARAFGRKIGSLWQENTIRQLIDIGEFQHAPPTMQRWLMAEPLTRGLYHKQLCDGYSETYVDNSPGDIGEDHYDYRRVVEGIYVDDEDGVAYATTYHGDYCPDEGPELDITQQVDILACWDSLRVHIASKADDPTSIWNSELN